MGNGSKEDVYSQPQENLHCSSVLDSRKIGCFLFSLFQENHEQVYEDSKHAFKPFLVIFEYQKSKVGQGFSHFLSFYPPTDPQGNTSHLGVDCCLDSDLDSCFDCSSKYCKHLETLVLDVLFVCNYVSELMELLL